MLKPLSPKTLEKKYAELNLPPEQIELLHTCFRCFANLYGVIDLRDAWDVFKHYEGTTVHRRDFIAFSGVVQREAGLPYSVYELREIYTGETTEDPLERMIVDNRLVMSGYYRFVDIVTIEENKDGKPYYLPPKSEFYRFRDDPFYRTPYGQRMKTFVEGLITSGVWSGYIGLEDHVLRGPDGESVQGKRLSEAVFLTPREQFEIMDCKSEAKKQKIEEKYRIPASEKVLNRIQRDIMVGSIGGNSQPDLNLQFLVDDLRKGMGAELNRKQLEQLFGLYTKLNNSSNLWMNSGWSPNELHRKMTPGTTKTVYAGLNMKKLFASGEWDEEEVRKRFAKMGIEFIVE